MVSVINNYQNPYGTYGTIQKIGISPNGRAIYRTIDSTGKVGGQLSLPDIDSKKFEKSFNDIVEVSPKIQEFSLKHSSEADIKKRRNMSKIMTAAGGIAGFAIPLFLTRKSPSTIKKIISSVLGSVIGLAVGGVASFALTTPPGTFKFLRAIRTISKLDIQVLPKKQQD